MSSRVARSSSPVTVALKKSKVSKGVPRPLQEQHRDSHSCRCAARSVRWLSRRVQREGEEHQAAHPTQRRERLRLRGHPPAERPAAGEQRQVGRGAPPRATRGAHRRVSTTGGGRPARSRAPCTETGSEGVATPRSARPSAIAAMDLWVIPAPAPWASTRQAVRCTSGACQRPETGALARNRDGDRFGCPWGESLARTLALLSPLLA